jgi:fibronectin type 3 domain-containing protein
MLFVDSRPGDGLSGLTSRFSPGAVTSRSRRSHRGAFFGTLLVLILALSSVVQPSATVRAVGPTCAVSGPPSAAYSLNVCISAPLDATTVSGDQTVTGTISVTGTNPGVIRAVFFLRGAYLLTDYSNPYTFVLPTSKFVDGAAVLELEADMRDGFVSTHAAVNLTFANGVVTPPVNTNTFTPRTPTPAAGQPLVVAAAGDGADGSPNETNATNLIAGWNPDMVLYLGDVYEKGTATEFRNWYGDTTAFYGRFRSKTNPVVGNHEYEGNAAPGYFDYWDNIPHYYSYNAGGWHFIALDSTSQFNQTSPGTAQYEWLQNDLATNTQACTLAYFHHPIYSVGPNGDTTRMNAIWSLFNSWSVDLVLAGHDHDYQRWLPIDGSGNPSPSGVTQFVVGTGGHGVQAFSRTDSRMAVGLDTSPAGIGALKLSLGADSATYQFISATQGQVDSGSVSCSPPTTDTTPPTAPASLSATALGSTRIDLGWSAGTDNIGVVGYDISRDGTYLTSVSGSTLTYSDTSVTPASTHSYTVKARDLAGNQSPASPAASATTASGTSAPIFTDDFESGTLTGWTNTGMVVQSAETFGGSWAARATTTSAASWAWHSLSATQTNLYYRIRFKVISQGANNMYLLKERTSTGTSIMGLYLGDSGNTLNYRNDAGLVTVRSPRTATVGVWHELQVHLVINGTSGQIETWLDGSKIPELSKTDNFGTGPVGRVQIGDNSGTRAFDLAIDDLVVDTQFISSAPPADTTAPSVPGNLTGTAVSSSRVDLNWSPSVDNVGVVGYDLIRDGEPLASVVGSSTSYSDTTVDAGSTFQFLCEARDAAGNVSGPSNVATVIVPATVPGVPTGLTATAGNGQVGLSWTAPVVNGGTAITGYKIYRSTTSGGETLFASPAGTATTYTNTGLTNGTAYFYKVTAVNGVGEGGLSGEASATPTATTTIPGAPTGLTATRGNGQVDLTWIPPASNGGSAITNYNVYRGTTSGNLSLVTTLGNVTTYNDPGLTNGTTHYYQVTAVNGVGEGASSNAASATPATPPGAPTGLGATGGDHQVALSWTAPANGGSTITGYKVYRGTAAGAEVLLIAPAGTGTTYTDTGLVNGTTYFYKVTAVNAVGEGALSAEASATPATTPDAPTNLTATPGPGQVVLSWTAPSSSGGSPVTGYKIYQGTTSGGESLVATIGNVTTTTRTGLTNGTTYYFKVAAINAAGDGSQSLEASATPVSAPGAPTGLTATRGNAQVTLSWSAPASNGGSAITGYNIYRSTTSGTEIKVASPTGTGTTYTDTGLVNGTTYFYKVTAANAVGEGALSTEASATPATVPGAPTGLTATAGNNQVSLSWTAPSNGGSAISAYNVYRSTTSGSENLLTTLGNVTSYKDPGLTAGTTYYYKVSAGNVVGEGGQSGEASATPVAAPPLLGEGFEAGSMTGWTAVGPMAATTLSPHTGTYAARAQCAGSACWAYRPFAASQTATDLYVQAWVYVAAQDNNTTNLFKLRTASAGSGTSVLGLLLNNKGRLSYRNDVLAKTVVGTHVVSTGLWHSITVHLVVGTSGHIDVWLDGVPLTELSRTDNFGTAAIGKIQIGENGSGGNFDVRFDDLSASTSVINPGQAVAQQLSISQGGATAPSSTTDTSSVTAVSPTVIERSFRRSEELPVVTRWMKRDLQDPIR